MASPTSYVPSLFLSTRTDESAVAQMVIVVGISFNLIIIRVDQGIAVGATYADTTTTPNSIPLHFRSSERSTTGVEVVISSTTDRELTDPRKVSVASAGAEGPKSYWDVV